MNARSDFALCPVRAISCTHHAHCARAQLKPHPTRQAWFTPNRRGDECQYFSPIEAYTLAEPENLGRSVTADEATVSGDARILTRPASAGAAARETAGESDSANTFGAARSARAVGQQPHGTATNATPRQASILSRALGPCERLGFVHEPAGVPSASAGLSHEQREQLHAAQILNLGAIE